MTVLSEYRKRLDALVSRTRLLTMDPSGERFAEARIIEALNFACLEFAMRTEAIKDEINIQLVENGWAYDVPERISESGIKRPYAWSLRVGYEGDEAPALKPLSTFTLDFTGSPIGDVGPSLHWRLDLMTYGQIAIHPIPSENGGALPLETGNIQVTYVAMPNVMATPATDYPDTEISPDYHEYLPYFAASWLLDEGNEQDMGKSVQYEMRWLEGIRTAVSDAYNLTSYGTVRPM